MRGSSVLVLFVLSLGSAQPPTDKILSFRGSVYSDETGAPVAAAEITLVKEAYGTRTLIGKTGTDERGAFAFANVPSGSNPLQSGSYTLWVERVGFLTNTLLEITAGRDIVVRLERVATVSGRVVDGDGRPLENALIEVTSKTYTYGEVTLMSSGGTRTDSQGLYRVSGLPPGRYYVRASCAGHEMVLYPSASALANAKSFDLAAGSDLRDIGFRLNSAPQFTISGQLMDAKTKGPAGAAFVGASSADLALTTFVEGTVRDGRFQIDGLKPDRYFLKFDWVRPGNSVKRTVIFPFEMGNADQTDVVLTAMPPVTVTGHVRTGKHPMPKTIAVTLLPSAEAISAHVGGNVGSTEIRADGTFTMTGVEAGEYRLGIHSAFPPRFFVKERTLTIDGSGPITGADLVLDFSAGSVVGRALDSAGKIIPSATVVLQSTDVEKRLIGQYRHIQRASMSGEYEITGVVPGDYLLFVWKGHPGLIGDPDLFAEASEEAIRLRVPAGATVSQNAVEMNATQ